MPRILLLLLSCCLLLPLGCSPRQDAPADAEPRGRDLLGYLYAVSGPPTEAPTWWFFPTGGTSSLDQQRPLLEPDAFKIRLTGLPSRQTPSREVLETPASAWEARLHADTESLITKTWFKTLYPASTIEKIQMLEYKGEPRLYAGSSLVSLPDGSTQNGFLLFKADVSRQFLDYYRQYYASAYAEHERVYARRILDSYGKAGEMRGTIEFLAGIFGSPLNVDYVISSRLTGDGVCESLVWMRDPGVNMHRGSPQRAKVITRISPDGRPLELTYAAVTEAPGPLDIAPFSTQ